MLENPTDFERANADAQYAAIAIAYSGRALLDFDQLPRRGQMFERARLFVPAKNFRGRGVNLQFCYKEFFARHIFGGSP